MTDSQSWMARLLQFDRDGDTFFIKPEVAPNPKHGHSQRLFGGLIAAQTLGAAGATVDPAKHPQSLHLYFVRGGSYGTPVELQVERTRDGRSFDTRRVTAVQHGKTILEMIASFHLPEPGTDWHPAAGHPNDLDDFVAKPTNLGFGDLFDFRTRPDDDSPFAVPPFWIRTKAEVEDVPLLRACALAFISDFGPVPVARPPGVEGGLLDGYSASLDHAVWFHRPFVPHEWHRYDVTSRNNSDARGLVAGSLYDRAGSLIASTSQEALWRF